MNRCSRNHHEGENKMRRSATIFREDLSINQGRRIGEHVTAAVIFKIEKRGSCNLIDRGIVLGEMQSHLMREPWRELREPVVSKHQATHHTPSMKRTNTRTKAIVSELVASKRDDCGKTILLNYRQGR